MILGSPFHVLHGHYNGFLVRGYVVDHGWLSTYSWRLVLHSYAGIEFFRRFLSFLVACVRTMKLNIRTTLRCCLVVFVFVHKLATHLIGTLNFKAERLHWIRKYIMRLLDLLCTAHKLASLLCVTSKTTFIQVYWPGHAHRYSSRLLANLISNPTHYMKQHDVFGIAEAMIFLIFSCVHLGFCVAQHSQPVHRRDP